MDDSGSLANRHALRKTQRKNFLLIFGEFFDTLADNLISHISFNDRFGVQLIW
jgi:hypothetical protein